MRMNKARPTMSASLIKHKAYLTHIKYNKNVNNNSGGSDELKRTLRCKINVKIKQ